MRKESMKKTTTKGKIRNRTKKILKKIEINL